MAKDYSTTLALAKRLIRNAGREVTLLKLSSESTDNDRPWLGPPTEVGEDEPRDTPADSATAFAVAVQPSSAVTLGLTATQRDLLKDVEQILIMEPGEDDPETLETFNVVRDGGVGYKILFVEKLRPAELTLLYFMGVAR